MEPGASQLWAQRDFYPPSASSVVSFPAETARSARPCRSPESSKSPPVWRLPIRLSALRIPSPSPALNFQAIPSYCTGDIQHQRTTDLRPTPFRSQVLGWRLFPSGFIYVHLPRRSSTKEGLWFKLPLLPKTQSNLNRENKHTETK
jgi:hypothetical protein